MFKMEKDKFQELLDSHIVELELPLRIVSILEANGIFSIRDLLMCCRHDPDKCDCGRKHVLGFRNINKRSLEMIMESLASLGFKVPQEYNGRLQPTKSDK